MIPPWMTLSIKPVYYYRIRIQGHEPGPGPFLFLRVANLRLLNFWPCDDDYVRKLKLPNIMENDRQLS